MSIQKIVVVGYPKSGNTWLTRLVAQILDCPVAGFLDDLNNNEIAIEGSDRNSDYEVFKAHHSWDKLKDLIHTIDKLIYVVRDPRDVAVSGAYYFNMDKFKDREQLESQDKFAAMVKTVSSGGSYSWCDVSWAEHVRGFLAQHSNVLIVRYEDLLIDGYTHLERIASFIGITISRQNIHQALDLQNFNLKKEKSIASYDKRNIRLLRAGKSGQYLNTLKNKEIHEIECSAFNEMVKLGYSITGEDKKAASSTIVNV